MATNLEITDLIRSKAVQPKPAMQSLKKRVASKNGRVQMYALGVSHTSDPAHRHHAEWPASLFSHCTSCEDE